MNRSRRHLGRAPIPWDLIVPHLGEVSDLTLARRHGCTVTTIREMRVRLEIPSHASMLAASRDVEIDAMLGRASDRAIAQMFGVNVSTIRRRRYRAGIRSHGQPQLPVRVPKPAVKKRKPKLVRLPRLDTAPDPNAWMWR